MLGVSVLEEKRNRKESFIDELIALSPIYVKEFKEIISPNVLGVINREMKYMRLEGAVLINTPTIFASYEIDYIGMRNGKIFVESRFDDWETAESEAKMLRKHGRKAYLLTRYDKPRIRIYLDDYDELLWYD